MASDSQGLGFIPIRSDSKGAPVRTCGCYAESRCFSTGAVQAPSARLLSRVVLTPTTKEIAEVGRNCGIEVPFLRPSCLAGDGSSVPGRATKNWTVIIDMPDERQRRYVRRNPGFRIAMLSLDFNVL